MAIQDVAYNNLPGAATGEMLGYTAPPDSPETLSLDMYLFLIEQIRIADQNEGGLFVKRFLSGPQQFWAETQAKIFALKTMWQVDKIPEVLLQFMKRIVGWTPDLDKITNRLDANGLRRLIAGSIPLWRKRGPEDAMLEAVSLVSGAARMRIWNWFDFRWVLDETVLGESHQGRDPWILEFPGPPNYSENYSNLRIVDDGTLDHVLVEEMVNLMRASGERVTISYIDFLDQFEHDGDNSQWEALDDDLAQPLLKEQFEVVGGKLVSSAGATSGGLSRIINSSVIVPQAVDWQTYVAYWRLSMAMDTPGGAPYVGPLFYYTDDDNYYYLRVKPKWPDSFALPASTTVELRKIVAGSDTSVATVDYLALTGGVLLHNVFYGYRIQVTPNLVTNEIKVFIDGNLIINTTDGDHTRGAIGVRRTDRAGYELDEAELFQLPLENVLIDINA